MRGFLLASSAIAALAFATTVQAQDNMQKLENMQSTGTGSETFQYVPQNDEYRGAGPQKPRADQAG
jgi:hypothetical protein